MGVSLPREGSSGSQDHSQSSLKPGAPQLRSSGNQLRERGTRTRRGYSTLGGGAGRLGLGEGAPLPDVDRSQAHAGPRWLSSPALGRPQRARRGSLGWASASPRAAGRPARTSRRRLPPAGAPVPLPAKQALTTGRLWARPPRAGGAPQKAGVRDRRARSKTRGNTRGRAPAPWPPLPFPNARTRRRGPRARADFAADASAGARGIPGMRRRPPSPGSSSPAGHAPATPRPPSRWGPSSGEADEGGAWPRGSPPRPAPPAPRAPLRGSSAGQSAGSRGLRACTASPRPSSRPQGPQGLTPSGYRDSPRCPPLRRPRRAQWLPAPGGRGTRGRPRTAALPATPPALSPRRGLGSGVRAPRTPPASLPGRPAATLTHLEPRGRRVALQCGARSESPL